MTLRTHSHAGSESLPYRAVLLRQLRSLVPALPLGSVVCGPTAAYLHGVDAYGDAPAHHHRTHVCAPGGWDSMNRRTVAVHRVRVPVEHIVRTEGVPLTTPVRTAADCAVWAPSIYVATDLVERFLTDTPVRYPELWKEAASPRSRSAQDRLAKALRLSCPLSQSPPETFTRVLVHEAGLPTPAPQCPVTTRLGVLRADLGWPTQRVLVEFDSQDHHRTRYGRRRDRQRYEAMREAGWTVLTVGMVHISRGAGRFAQELFDALLSRGWECGPHRRSLVERRIWRLPQATTATALHGMSGTLRRGAPRPRTLARGDRGGAALEYAAVVTLVAALLTVVVVHGPWERPSEEVGAAAERVLGVSGPGHEPGPDGGPELDPLAAADAARRCVEGSVSPDPVGRVDCALALLGLLESEVLEATVLQLTPEELHDLFSSRTFTATGVARVAVRLLWEHASTEALERLVETRTFAFLEPVLSSPRTEFALRFVRVGHEYLRATLERAPE